MTATQAAAGRRQRGFTLLEVLIAFIIAALALAALLQGSAGGLQNARIAAHYEEAIARARSRLAALTAERQGGEQSGDDGGGFRWRQRVAPAGDTLLAGPGAARPVLLDVSVAVSWRLDGRAREVVLRTQRLALLPSLNIRENLLMPFWAARRAVPEAELAELTAELEIADLLDRRPSEVSFGEQQRAAIARAVLRSPEL